MYISDDFLKFVTFSSFGLLTALVLYFNKDLIKFFRDSFSKKRSRRQKKSKPLLNVVLTCVIGASAGWAITDIIQRNYLFNDAFSLSIAISVTGIIMIIIDNVIQKDTIKDETKLDESHALIIGASEVFAAIPGVFHTASTIISGRLLGMNNNSAARYSFITIIPFLFGVFICAFFATDSINYFVNNLGTLLVSNLIVFIASYFIIKLILKILSTPKTLQWFGYSRIVIGLTIAIVALLI